MPKASLWMQKVKHAKANSELADRLVQPQTLLIKSLHESTVNGCMLLIMALQAAQCLCVRVCV